MRAKQTAPRAGAPRPLLNGAALSALSRSFNSFLGVDAKSVRRITRQCRKLIDFNGFAESFYKYLLSHAPTSGILRDFEQRGGSIRALIRSQEKHLKDMLSAHVGAKNAGELIRLGELHFRHGVEPLWVMGGYRLYADFVGSALRSCTVLPDKERGRVEEALRGLIYRDMGLITQGYWLAANRALESERGAVIRLNEQIALLHANIPHLLWSVDVTRRRFLYISPAAREAFGDDAEVPIPGLSGLAEIDRARVCGAWARALSGKRAEAETPVRRPNGGLRWLRRAFYPFEDEQGCVIRIDCVAEDVTDARELKDRLRKLSTTDSLTGLPNRALFLDRLERALALTGQDPVGGTVVMFVDIDRFKEVNDVLGHPVGDSVLLEIAQRIAGSLREHDTIARVGDDEFGILLPSVANPAQTAPKLARKVLDEVARPVRIYDREIYLGATIGIVLHPQHGVEPETLLRRADAAMFACKGKDVGFLVYDHSIEESATQRLQLGSDLQRALDRGELELYFQPILSIGDGRVEAVEALARWNHPRFGLVAPDRFIPLAERSGLTAPLTDWAIETALHRAEHLHRRGWPLRVAVNVSGRAFRDPSLPERVARIVGTSRLGGDALEVEVTENVLMSEVEQVGHMLARLKQLGVRTAMDDFGSGYSSLAYLTRLPIDRIKIDKSLVIGMEEDDASAMIVRAIVELGHNLGREVTAEGVENGQVLSLLNVFECDAAQGFALSRPLTAAELDAWLAARDELDSAAVA